jgi:hypothetical protein
MFRGLKTVQYLNKNIPRDTKLYGSTELSLRQRTRIYMLVLLQNICPQENRRMRTPPYRRVTYET